VCDFAGIKSRNTRKLRRPQARHVASWGLLLPLARSTCLVRWPPSCGNPSCFSQPSSCGPRLRRPELPGYDRVQRPRDRLVSFELLTNCLPAAFWLFAFAICESTEPRACDRLPSCSGCKLNVYVKPSKSFGIHSLHHLLSTKFYDFSTVCFRFFNTFRKAFNKQVFQLTAYPTWHSARLLCHPAKP